MDGRHVELLLMLDRKLSTEINPRTPVPTAPPKQIRPAPAPAPFAASQERAKREVLATTKLWLDTVTSGAF